MLLRKTRKSFLTQGTFVGSVSCFIASVVAYYCFKSNSCITTESENETNNRKQWRWWKRSHEEIPYNEQLSHAERVEDVCRYPCSRLIGYDVIVRNYYCKSNNVHKEHMCNSEQPHDTSDTNDKIAIHNFFLQYLRPSILNKQQCRISTESLLTSSEHENALPRQQQEQDKEVNKLHDYSNVRLVVHHTQEEENKYKASHFNNSLLLREQASSLEEESSSTTSKESLRELEEEQEEEWWYNNNSNVEHDEHHKELERSNPVVFASSKWPNGLQKYSALIIAPSSPLTSSTSKSTQTSVEHTSISTLNNSLQEHTSSLETNSKLPKPTFSWFKMLVDNYTQQSVVKCNSRSALTEMNCEADPSVLIAPYTRTFISSFLLLPSSFFMRGLRVGVLGTGGGALSNFIQHVFGKHLTLLDLIDVEPMCFYAALHDLGMKAGTDVSDRVGTTVGDINDIDNKLTSATSTSSLTEHSFSSLNGAIGATNPVHVFAIDASAFLAEKCKWLHKQTTASHYKVESNEEKTNTSQEEVLSKQEHYNYLNHFNVKQELHEENTLPNFWEVCWYRLSGKRTSVSNNNVASNCSTLKHIYDDDNGNSIKERPSSVNSCDVAAQTSSKTSLDITEYDRSGLPYDVLFVDLFCGSTMSSEVCSLEFVQQCQECLSSQGVAAFNLPTPSKSFVQMCRSTFGRNNVYVIPVRESSNVIILARASVRHFSPSVETTLSGATRALNVQNDSDVYYSNNNNNWYRSLLPSRKTRNENVQIDKLTTFSHRHFYRRAKEFQSKYKISFDLSKEFPF